MSRGLWFAAGAGAGIYAVVRGRRAAEALSADGLRDRVGAAVLGARLLRDEVAAGRAERETELREDLQHRSRGPHQLSGPTGPPREAPAGAPEEREH